MPILAIVGPPFALEIFFPAASRPEFGFFQVDGFRARIERALNAARKIPAIILARRDIRDVSVSAVQDQIAVNLLLRLVPVVLPIVLKTTPLSRP